MNEEQRKKLKGNFVGKMVREAKGLDGDRGARAALRMGVGKPAGQAVSMFPYVARYLHEELSPKEIDAMFITAALIGLHPEHSNGQNLGAAVRAAHKNKDGLKNVVTRTFMVALDAHPDDLPKYLETLVRLCENAGVGIDWHWFLSSVENLTSDLEIVRDIERRALAKSYFYDEEEALRSDIDSDPTPETES